MTTTTNEQAALIEQVRASYAARLDTLNALLATKPRGCVYCWPSYALGVLITDGVPSTVAIENATVVANTVNRSRFCNGAKETAALMTRKAALAAAITSITKTARQFELAVAQ